MILLFALAAQATTGFDPTAPSQRFEGQETTTQDGSIQLWSAVERLEDPDRTLFTEEDFNSLTEWPADSQWAPWIDDCFGTATPASWTFLLHMGPHEATATGTPILFVPGAGDNGSRGFITMATHMDQVGRPVYALTFAHPHGDVFQQAEVVADAIARVRARTGAAQVDVVSHSKGGVATAVYLSNHAGAEWERDDYLAQGTRYRDDVRRAVFIATPLGGIDTGYRWPLANTASLTADTAMAPVSWAEWYPWGTGYWWVYTDLGEQDFLPGGERDLFPGHRQLLATWDDVYPLPGSLWWLGAYAMQTDWWTTYYGGWGYLSYSDGIDAAIATGDGLLDDLALNGIDPDVKLFILAGTNPLMPNGAEDFLAQYMGEAWVDMATAGTDLWAALVAAVVGDTYAGLGVTEEEVQGLAQGKLVLGEISGPSDGLVFVDSATMEETLTARGAVVVEVREAPLSHLDLLYASPVTGALLIAEAEADPVEDGWKAAVGERYVEADTIGWVEAVLADPVPTDTGADSGEVDGRPDADSGGDDDDEDATSPTATGCGCGAATAPGTRAWALPLLALVASLFSRSTARVRRGQCTAQEMQGS